jgi:hypothetical protein
MNDHRGLDSDLLQAIVGGVSWVTMMEDVAKIFPEGLSYVFNQTTTKLRDWRVDRLFRDVLHEDKAKYSGRNEPENHRYSKHAFVGISECQLKEGDWP